MTRINNLLYDDGEANQMVLRIVEAVQPEIIICYGCRKKHMNSWSCFLPSDEKRTSASYDLLVVIPEGGNRLAHEIIDSIDSCLKDMKAKANVIVHSFKAVNNALPAGHPFFTKVCRDGVIMYQRCEMALSNWGRGQANCLCTNLADEVAGFKLARQFLKGALYFSSHGYNNVALFMLHQAAEHACNFMVRFMTGYRPSTHNLSRLLAMTENFSDECSAIFPSTTPEEKDLVSTLAKGYYDARYKEAFFVAGWKVSILTDRVTLLQVCAERMCRLERSGIEKSANPDIS